MIGFTAKDVPGQAGKTFLVTGANTGLGLEVAKVLAAARARVLIGCRSLAKAERARQQIIADTPAADVAVIQLDLGDLASVHEAAEQVMKEPRLDVLINNAGIMVPPYELTRDGFESQFGVNHLGPFALSALLLPRLRDTPGARVVSTSSIAHRQGRIIFADINAERRYKPGQRYAMSKIANLYFCYELQRRLQRAGADTLSVAAHPGIADTELSRYLPAGLRLVAPVLRPLFNSAAQGAWPTLCAAAAPDVAGGEYYGPGKRGETAGPAQRVHSVRRSHDREIAERLWDLSVAMTGVNPGI